MMLSVPPRISIWWLFLSLLNKKSSIKNVWFVSSACLKVFLRAATLSPVCNWKFRKDTLQAYIQFAWAPVFTLEKEPSLDRNVDLQKVKRRLCRIFDLYSQSSKAVYGLQEIVHSNAILVTKISLRSSCGNWQKPPFLNKDIWFKFEIDKNGGTSCGNTFHEFKINQADIIVVLRVLFLLC